MEDKDKKLTPTSSRILEPMILQTKEELRTALKTGRIKTSKYNLLDDQEKLFVELICFGGYTGEQAIRAMSPGVRNALAAANRLLASPEVQSTIEELTVAKDRKFQAEVSSAREMALERLKYIMMTTKDEALSASCAKTIMDKAEAAVKKSVDKEEPVGQVRFNIQVENVYTGGPSPKPEEPVIIELTPEEIDPVYAKVQADKEALLEEQKQIEEDIKKKKGIKPNINPETGLPFTLVYEGVNNYEEE